MISDGYARMRWSRIGDAIVVETQIRPAREATFAVFAVPTGATSGCGPRGEEFRRR